MVGYKVKKKFQEFSNIELDDLIKNTQNKSIFKKDIWERVKKIGHFEYLGFEYTYNRNKKGNLTLFITMYFYVTSAPHKKKAGNKRDRYKIFRKKYLVAIKFPYIDGMKNYNRLLNVPIKIFSSDESFNYFLAYALNTHNAVILDDPVFINHIHYAITHKPRIRNPELKTELTKHLYKVIEFLLKYRPIDYLDDKYLLDKIPKIPNKLNK